MELSENSENSEVSEYSERRGVFLGILRGC